MEVVSGKVIEDFYFIWSESDVFHVEDMEANKILSLSASRLHWFV